MKQEQFLTDAGILKAVLVDLTIIGETARHIPEVVLQAFP